jgi:hypothetical protein
VPVLHRKRRRELVVEVDRVLARLRREAKRLRTDDGGCEAEGLPSPSGELRHCTRLVLSARSEELDVDVDVSGNSTTEIENRQSRRKLDHAEARAGWSNTCRLYFDSCGAPAIWVTRT